MTFSIEDHGILIPSSPFLQALVSPRVILINSDHLAAKTVVSTEIRSSPGARAAADDIEAML